MIKAYGNIMSDTIFQLIPDQPAYVPDEETASLAEQFLRSHLPGASEVYAEVSEEIRFIDAGANYESVSCPICGKEIANEWWLAAMDEAYESQFNNLDIVVPCCGSKASLNNLDYHSPQGFARFVLSARNPDIQGLDGQAMQELEMIVGSKLRAIVSHY